MIKPVGAIGSEYGKCDSEYMMILMEMRKLGLTPTGNKAIDKVTLEAEKQKIAQKIYDKFEAKMPEKTDNSERAVLEEQKLGAMTVAELNKILHGLA